MPSVHDSRHRTDVIWPSTILFARSASVPRSVRWSLRCRWWRRRRWCLRRLWWLRAVDLLAVLGNSIFWASVGDIGTANALNTVGVFTPDVDGVVAAAAIDEVVAYASPEAVPARASVDSVVTTEPVHKVVCQRPP